VRVIAIDGPAGSGKSTVARALAERLGLDYLDTGAMYRSVAFAALEASIDPADADALAELAQKVDIVVGQPPDAKVTVDGADATSAIRGPEVSGAVSVVAANPAVRREMVKRQQDWAREHGGGVVEGRDIGTVVFPDAELKVFLTASDEERARRRGVETGGAGWVAGNIAHRDRLDSTRAASPMVPADDALQVDTTGRTVDQIVDQLMGALTS
jgi:cytidylate kinase